WPANDVRPETSGSVDNAACSSVAGKHIAAAATIQRRQFRRCTTDPAPSPRVPQHDRAGARDVQDSPTGQSGAANAQAAGGQRKESNKLHGEAAELDEIGVQP